MANRETRVQISPARPSGPTGAGLGVLGRGGWVKAARGEGGELIGGQSAWTHGMSDSVTDPPAMPSGGSQGFLEPHESQLTPHRDPG